MARQKTDWGDILWIDEEDLLSVEGLKVGIVTLPGGGHQQKHVHFEEQVIYVMQGQAISIVDGEKSYLHAGSYFHWKAGIVHEIYNTGQVPFQHLLISNPGYGWRDLPENEEQRPETEDGTKKEYEKLVEPELLYLAVEAIRTQFLETLHYGYVIFDARDNLVLQSKDFPDYCRKCCNPEKHPGCVPCMLQMNEEDKRGEAVIHCPYGMDVLHYPIHFRGTFLGYMQGGYFRGSQTGVEGLEQVYESPKSVVAGVKALLRRTVKAMKNYCEFEQFRRELMERELYIVGQEERQRILLQDLHDTQYALTDLKINNHFLFNTLNSMASMALDGGMVPLYQSIVDLSKMFRYTLRNQSAMVPLEKEIEYVRSYLQLQKLRYGDTLKVVYDIDRSFLEMEVPFNFMQPVVENAFIHGFKETGERRITILVKRRGGMLEIRITNSGQPLTPSKCNAINQAIQANTSHGLCMIYHKLKLAYGENCSFYVAVEVNGDTSFISVLPVETGAEASGTAEGEERRNDASCSDL